VGEIWKKLISKEADVCDFINACKEAMPVQLGAYDPGQLFLSTSIVGDSLRNSLTLQHILSQSEYKNDDEHPFYINIIQSSIQGI
jgi:hypothetical protein